MSVLSTVTGLAADTTRRLVRVPMSLAGNGLTVVSGLFGREGAADNAAQAMRHEAAVNAEQDRVIDLTDRAPVSAPFPAYERLSGDSVMRHVRDTADVEQLRAILAFEQAHKARKGVLQALDTRLGELV